MISLSERLRAFRVLPVLVLDDARLAAKIGGALSDCGLPLAEVTLRTDAAVQALRELATVPGLLLGAGTVRRPEQVDSAVSAGAEFVVTPGFSRSVIVECARLGVPVVPGIATATELMMALDEGVTLVKFFPASASGGPAAVRALAGPFSEASFVPTGGVNAANMADYLAIEQVAAVGGSWMVAAEIVQAGDIDQVRRRTADAVAIAGAVA